MLLTRVMLSCKIVEKIGCKYKTRRRKLVHLLLTHSLIVIYRFEICHGVAIILRLATV